MATNDFELIRKALGVSASMSYNDTLGGENPKGLIRELCRRLGRRAVRIEKRSHGWMMIGYYGEQRLLSLSEVVIWRLFKRPPIGHYVLNESSAVSGQTAFDVHPE